MAELGKWLVVTGLLIVAAGLAIWFVPGAPWLGRLPGDLTFERDGVRIFLPIGSCLLVSVVISLAIQILSRLR